MSQVISSASNDWINKTFDATSILRLKSHLKRQQCFLRLCEPMDSIWQGPLRRRDRRVHHVCLCSRPLPRSAPAPSPLRFFPAASAVEKSRPPAHSWTGQPGNQSQEHSSGHSCVYRVLGNFCHHVPLESWSGFVAPACWRLGSSAPRGPKTSARPTRVAASTTKYVLRSAHRTAAKRRSASIMTPLISLASELLLLLLPDMDISCLAHADVFVHSA